MFRAAAAPLLVLLAAGCAARGGPEPVAALDAQVEEQWRRAAAPADVARIDGLADAWAEGLAAARNGGFAAKAAVEGALLDPEAALPRPAPSPGTYMCRMVRLGGPGRVPAYAAFKSFFCHVGIGADGRLSFTKQTGTERPAGYLWEDGEAPRLVFLGSLAPGDAALLAYGDDSARDMIGVFERIGPLRFRLVVPAPRGGAKLEVLELTPSPSQAD